MAWNVNLKVGKEVTLLILSLKVTFDSLKKKCVLQVVAKLQFSAVNSLSFRDVHYTPHELSVFKHNVLCNYVILLRGLSVTYGINMS